MAKPIVALQSDDEHLHGNPDKTIVVMLSEDEIGEQEEKFVLDENSDLWKEEISDLGVGEVLPLWDHDA